MPHHGKALSWIYLKTTVLGLPPWFRTEVLLCLSLVGRAKVRPINGISELLYPLKYSFQCYTMPYVSM